MRRLVTLLATVLFGLLFSGTAHAGSPHFVDDTVTVVAAGETLTVSGKEAGLGNELQVHIVATAEAACLNPGQQFPQATNKQTVTAEGTFPVMNGKAYFELVLTASFQPSCSPPMSIVWGPVTLQDVTNNVTWP
jgi:hypothetical protein